MADPGRPDPTDRDTCSYCFKFFWEHRDDCPNALRNRATEPPSPAHQTEAAPVHTKTSEEDGYTWLDVTVEICGDSENSPAEVLHHLLSREPLIRAWSDARPLQTAATPEVAAVGGASGQALGGHHD